MKKGEIYEGIIDHVDFPNKGRIYIEDQLVTVKNGIPGQKIRFIINKKRSGRTEGRLLEILEPSPLEVREPVCSLFPSCGGCMYQTMQYEDQLTLKSSQVKALIEEALIEGGQVDTHGHADVMFDGIKRSPDEFGYRNKMEFTFGDEYKDGPLSLGQHKKGSTYDILSVTDCKLVHNDFNQIVQAVLAYCKNQKFTYYHKMRHEGFLRHLLIRRSHTTGEILICLVTTGEQKHDWTHLCKQLLQLPLDGSITGVLHMRNDSLADVVCSDETTILYGHDYFYETILGLKFKISPFSFFQTNSKGAEVLYSTARDYIGNTKDMTVFDLYSGTGTIAQMIAPIAQKVIGVEIVNEAVEAAKLNAALNGLSNCAFIAGDVLKVLDDLSEKPDYIILDPPRDGIHPKALPKIIQYGVPQMVYISCKPTSLARDLKVFLKNGYRVERFCCVDMFCETVHVETVVLLTKEKRG